MGINSKKHQYNGYHHLEARADLEPVALIYVKILKIWDNKVDCVFLRFSNFVQVHIHKKQTYRIIIITLLYFWVFSILSSFIFMESFSRELLLQFFTELENSKNKNIANINTFTVNPIFLRKSPISWFKSCYSIMIFSAETCFFLQIYNEISLMYKTGFHSNRPKWTLVLQNGQYLCQEQERFSS